MRKGPASWSKQEREKGNENQVDGMVPIDRDREATRSARSS